MIDFDRLETIVFDCDGVILNSNEVKSRAFYATALPYGKECAQSLVSYHKERGGISRYKKFQWFLSKYVDEPTSAEMDVLLNNYASAVSRGLLECDLVPGLKELRDRTLNTNWLIVSGGDQEELRTVFKKRGISDLFDGGIFGSPHSKEEILAREKRLGNIKSRSLFLGDSKYDHTAAQSQEIPFVFLSYWTEFDEWESYCKSNNIRAVDRLETL